MNVHYFWLELTNDAPQCKRYPKIKTATKEIDAKARDSHALHLVREVRTFLCYNA